MKAVSLFYGEMYQRYDTKKKPVNTILSFLSHIWEYFTVKAWKKKLLLRRAWNYTGHFHELDTIHLKSGSGVSIAVQASETVFAISYTAQHGSTSLTALEELDNRVANEYVPCCSNQHRGRMGECGGDHGKS